MAESLVQRRPRRSTAGNRMESALAELAFDETNQDLDDDNEFLNDKDEEDLFESDFASTDEETNNEEMDAGDKAVHDEEKSARKAARVRLEKQTAIAHDRNKATFNPQSIPLLVTKSVQRQKKTAPSDIQESTTSDVLKRVGQKRKSQRRHTILNTSATDSRMRETEEKKASAQKKFKPTIKSFSQAELIQRALDNEEGNIKEHKNYLKAEEEKRKKARTIKTPSVTGPVLRWISKVEDEKYKVQVEVTPQPTAIPAYGQYTAAQMNSYYTQLYQYLASHSRTLTTQAGSDPTTVSTEQTSTSQLLTVSGTPFFMSTPSVEAAVSEAKFETTVAMASVRLACTPATVSTAPSSSATAAAPSTTAYSSQFRNTIPYSSTSYNTLTPTTAASTPVPSVFQPTFFTPSETTVPMQSSQKQYVEEERTEKVAKNYVIVEADQQDGIAKPPWKDLMTAMFGDHTKWDEVKVLAGKGRPLGRVKQRCPITGQIAPYLDPRTGVPFADAEAYKTLTELVDHDYFWSPELGRYVGRG